MTRKSFHMHFVDDRLRGWSSQRRVTFPVVQARITTTLFIARGGFRLFLERFATVVLRDGNSAAIRIKQEPWQQSNRNPLRGSNGP